VADQHDVVEREMVHDRRDVVAVALDVPLLTVVPDAPCPGRSRETTR
jgi:hypothetical protein